MGEERGSPVARESAKTAVEGRDESVARESLPPGSLVGRFVILSEIGKGGSARVYAAHDPTLGRTVAIKMLSEIAVGERGRLQLFAEAKTMARVRHPNVVAIYDVGEHAGRVYIAMEHVKGGTLRPFVQEPRPFRETLSVLLGAARGLAAAHKAGVVHLDFKPENVLLEEGTTTPRVTDFGIARASGDSGHPSFVEPGHLVAGGTPAYMTPEQIAGSPLDARADQFAFCLVLHEALSGARPFPTAWGDRLEAIVEERITPGPRPIPPWIQRIIRRGLRREPSERFPSMDALAQELQRDPTRRRALALGAALAGGALLLLATAGATREHVRRTSCAAQGRDARSAWSAEASARVAAAFAGTGGDWEPAFEQTRLSLDAYATSLERASTRACVYPEAAEGPTLRRKRDACLRERSAELRHLVALLEKADVRLAQEAPEAAAALAPVEACDSMQDLLASVALPERDDAREQVLQLRDELAEVRALADAGLHPEAAERASRLVERARAVGDEPTLARALVLHGRELYSAQSDPASAIAELAEAFEVGLAARDFASAASAAAHATSFTGMLLRKWDEGHRWARVGEAALARLTSQEAVALRAELARSESYVYASQDDGESARTCAMRALDLAKAAGLPILEPYYTVLGVAQSTAGDNDAARASLSAALDDARRAFGARSLRAANRLGDVARLDLDALDAGAVIRDYSEMMAIYESSGLARHLNVGIAARERAVAYEQLGDCDAALADVARAKELLLPSLGEGDMAEAYLVEASCALRAGRRADAVAFAQKLDALTEHDAPDPPVVAGAHFIAARALWPHDRARSIALAKRAEEELAPAAKRVAEKTLVSEIRAWRAARRSPRASR